MNVRVLQLDVHAQTVLVKDVVKTNSCMDTKVLWDNYSQEIRAYIQARIQGPAVDDILQQVFLKAHEKGSTLKDSKAAKAWLYRITQHTLIDRYRKEYWWKSWEMSDFFWDQLEEDTAENNKQTLVKNIGSCLLPMIKDLDEQSKQVLERYLNPDVSQKMIAEELWISVSNVKVIIYRAKWKLKDMYEQCCYQYRDEQGNLIDTWCSSNCGCSNSVVR